MSSDRLLRLSDNRYTRAAAIMALCALLLSGCARERSHSQAVARIDGTELTAADLAATCDTTGPGRARARTYINDWIIRQMLYMESVRRGIADGDEVRRQVVEARMQLAIAAFLDKELDLRDSARIPEEAVKASFDSSAAAYALNEDVVAINAVLFSERDAANTFRSRVLRGTAWDEAVRQTRADSAAQKQLQQVIRHQYFTHGSLYPEELWKVARMLGINAVSFVVRTDNGYYVLQGLGVKHQGEIPDFAYVRDDVRNRMLVRLRRARYDQLLRDLRAKHTVEIRFDSTFAGIPDSIGGRSEGTP